MPDPRDFLPPPPWEGPPIPKIAITQDPLTIETYIRMSGIQNKLGAAMFNVREARDALARDDFRTAIDQFGVGHEHLREVTVLAQELPLEHTRRILESRDYRQLLQELYDLEETIIAYGESR